MCNKDTLKYSVTYILVLFIFIYSPKNKNLLQITHPQTIQDVDEFVSSSEQIWENVALCHILISVYSAVNGCRQNNTAFHFTRC